MALRSSPETKGAVSVVLALIFAAAWIVNTGSVQPGSFEVRARTFPAPTGSAHLISVESLPEEAGEECIWTPASASSGRRSAMQEDAAPSSGSDSAKRPPVREIHDPYPSFSSIAVDVKHDEIVMTDENLFQVLVYDRRTNTPARATMSEPRRAIGGEKTKIEFQCGLYIDPESGDIYAVNNDTVDTLAIFSRNAKGNVAPDRELRTPHGTFGIAVDEGRSELFLTVQHSNSIVIYDKMATGDDQPLRLIQGSATRLADPHGIALDPKNKVMFVTNHGSLREFHIEADGKSTMPTRSTIAGSGRVVASSINVYAIDAKGDVAPIRVITGPNTQMNWATGLAVDEERGELYVANDMDDSVLVFRTDAEGDVAPVRMLKGPKTGMKNPTGIMVDSKNGELLVANFGNHSATIYKLPAGGNTAPLRKIRSGPSDQPALMIGNPGSVAYDSKREEILVPN